MKFTYQLIPEQNLVLEEYIGEINYHDIKKVISDELEELVGKKYSAVLTDMREAHINLTYDEMSEYCRWLSSNDTIDYQAIVVSRTVDFGMSRMFAMLTDEGLCNNEANVFYDYEEAKNWITSKNVD